MFSGQTPFEESGMIVAEFDYTCGQNREVQLEDRLRLVLAWNAPGASLMIYNLFLGLPFLTFLYI
jgi:hypothetical protein